MTRPDVTGDLTRDAYAVMLAAFRGPTMPTWLPDAYRQGLAGICLYGDNVDADGDLSRLAREVSALDPTAVLAADEEGGDVTRLHMREGSPAPGNLALGIVDDTDLTRTIAEGIGAELRDAGIWLDLAPCADVNSNPDNPVIGNRSFGADPHLVARHTVAFVEGLAEQGVAASVKHFPGHGDTTADSHIDLPRVTADPATVRARELVPFVAAIEAGVATIMTSHVVLDAFDAERPATLSRAVLTGLVREELGYEGVIVTDALDMAGASATLGIDGAAVASLAAGADLLCLGPEPTDGPATLELAVDAVVTAVTDGTLPRDRLADAARRVRTLRDQWRVDPHPGRQPLGVPPTRRSRVGGGTSGGKASVTAQIRATTASRSVAQQVIARQSIQPLTGPATVVRIDTGTNPAVGDTEWGRLDVPGDRVDLTPADLASTTPFTGDVIVVARRAHADPAAAAWIEQQLAANPNARLIDLATLGSSPTLTAALSEALRGEA